MDFPGVAGHIPFPPPMVPPPMPHGASRPPGHGMMDSNHQAPAPVGGPQPAPAPFTPPFMFPPLPGIQAGAAIPPPDLMAAWMSNPAAFQAAMALHGFPPPPGMPPMGPSTMPPAAHVNFPPPPPNPRGATFVNAKQYNRILKRREARAKMEELFEAKRAADAAKKPYIHESRHRHAMKRPRGKGGRFLTKDELKEYYKKHPDRDPKNLVSEAGSESPNSAIQSPCPPAKKHKHAYQDIAASVVRE